MTRARLDVYLNSETFGTVHAADLVVLEAQAAVEKVGFRYRPAYLELPGAFAIDPLALPLGSEERQFDCRGGIPAFLDDYLPDAWGRQVLTYLAYYRDQNRFNANSVIDTLRLIGANRLATAGGVIPSRRPRRNRSHNVITVVFSATTTYAIWSSACPSTSRPIVSSCSD